ncbi:conserved hypothetical protein [Leishmania major strain Friedlin]|uniref:Uncharacterized protein n=1 Tax=Leishmania major TaxID=5664 RepID=Q4QIF3_LEIMA|nr:conserved hypothetical protein [Leishmania major strain Friedlin]CAG9569314.1 hypothetical_protein_-_conserved [Leishmania major strain Friedlin]CAJ02195.1 conserved hypothetical protein [Leishmania major strain Friedlin]|eukprot:XP_001681045.1 conserved hypothetical protein [Leishmania major strain Friedlin]
MIRHRCRNCFAGRAPKPLSVTAWVERRGVSTRQAERLGRASSRPTASGTATSHASPSGIRGASRAARGPAQRATKLSSPSAGASATSATAQSAASSGRAKPLPGRFNRLVVQLGVLVTVYHYILGESINLFLTYLLHSHRLGIGDTGSWLGAVGVPVDRFLNVGPTVYGLQLSPRLVLNYLVVNACMYPSMPLQLRLCIATAPILRGPFQVMGRLLGVSKKAAVPKAPSATPS